MVNKHQTISYMMKENFLFFVQAQEMNVELKKKLENEKKQFMVVTYNSNF